jgi:hypothetical protein
MVAVGFKGNLLKFQQEACQTMLSTFFESKSILIVTSAVTSTAVFYYMMKTDTTPRPVRGKVEYNSEKSLTGIPQFNSVFTKNFVH